LPLYSYNMENKLHPQCRLIEIIIENQELDNVTKLRLVQPLLFGDKVIEVSQKFQVLDISTKLQLSVSAL